MWTAYRILVVFFLILLSASTVFPEKDEDIDLVKEVKQLKKTVRLLSRQLMLQQFFAEEKTRSDGNSGLKQIRTEHGGSKNYFSNTFSGDAFAAMHDHANNIRTVGLGEFSAVLNGVHFRTRHNDYRLNQPHSTSKEYHAVEPIKFPDVPPEVLRQPNISSQIEEMREWFKAWKTSNHSVRDYRNYFQPVLCYLEGSWTKSRDAKIDEPFESDRHVLDAETWFELQEKVKFTSYTGTKSLSENLAFLPTTIMRFKVNKKNPGEPMYAQWNYRILCHKLKTHIPLTKFRPVEDLASRMSRNLNMTEYANSRAARFELDLDLDPRSTTFSRRKTKYNFLDKLMREIPGKDNYQGKLFNGGFDVDVMEMDGKTEKDVSRYHRWFKLKQKDAMGKSESHRGYADQYLFAAKTTQRKVAGMKLEMCEKNVNTKKRTCGLRDERWSYAIPLEIIYLTPLTKWNPHQIQVKKRCKKEQINRQDTRVGKGLCTNMKKAKLYACPKFYYITPDMFFSGKEVDADPADTAHSGGWCMLDRNKNGVVARATGTRIFFPKIKGIGKLRQRFPIAPVHDEGNPIWKNLNALRDIVLNNGTFDFMKYENGDGPDKSLTFQLPMSKAESRRPPHSHYFTLMQSEVEKLKRDGSLIIDTTERQNHMHTLEIKYDKEAHNFYYELCDHLPMCYDLHPRILKEVK